MKPDEQLFSLMAVAEEQQRLVTLHIEQQEEATRKINEIQRQFIQDAQDCQGEVQRNFESNLSALSDKLSNKVGWSQIFLTSLICLLLSVMTVTGLLLYLKGTIADIQEARAIKSKLEGYRADLTTCERKDGSQHPCVRVMASWGGHGEFHDYFIIDPL